MWPNNKEILEVRYTKICNIIRNLFSCFLDDPPFPRLCDGLRSCGKIWCFDCQLQARSDFLAATIVLAQVKWIIWFLPTICIISEH